MHVFSDPRSASRDHMSPIHTALLLSHHARNDENKPRKGRQDSNDD